MSEAPAPSELTPITRLEPQSPETPKPGDLDITPLDVPTTPKNGGGKKESPRKPEVTTSQRKRAQSMRQSIRESASFDELLASMGASMASSGGGDDDGLDAVQMAADVDLLKARMRNSSRGLLNPNSKFMQYWDFFTLSALFFTATVTPYEVCLMWEESKFADGPSEYLTPLFVLNWIVNLIFMVDIVFKFFLPYKEPIKKGGGTVKSHRKIAKNYLCGWFALDFVSIIPVDNIMMAIDTSQIRGASVLGAIRMLRLLRLIKLARILRASRIFSRWENKISMSYSNRNLLFWFVFVLFSLHMLACLLGLLAQLMAAPRDELLEAEVHRVYTEEDSQCYGCMPRDLVATPFNAAMCKSLCLTPCEATSLARLQLQTEWSLDPFYVMNTTYASDEIAARVELVRSQENWLCRYMSAGKVRSMPTWHGELWMAALYVAMIQLGGGVGSIVPENHVEYLVFFLGMFLGSVTWAMVVGTICAVLTTGDPHTLAFKTNMDSLNYFLEDMNMDGELRMRAREYLRNTRDLYKKRAYNDLMVHLSHNLRQEVVLLMSEKLLKTVWYLADLKNVQDGDECLVELSLSMTRNGFAPREKIPHDRLNILMRGVAAKAGNILTPVCTWGEDIITSAAALRDKRVASALTYVEVASISRGVMDEVFSRFPHSKKLIQQAAMKIAMQRAIVVVSEFVKLSRGTNRNSIPPATSSAGAMLAELQQPKFQQNGKIDAAAVIPLLTGTPFRDVEELEREEEEAAALLAASSPRKGGGGGGDGLDGEAASAIMKRLQAQDAKSAALQKEMGEVKSALNEVLSLLKKK